MRKIERERAAVGDELKREREREQEREMSKREERER